MAAAPPLDPARPPPIHPLHQLVRCSNTLVREAARVMAPHGLTPAQFNVLNLISQSPHGCRPSDIARDLVVDPSSATYLIAQLTKLGALRRSVDSADRRAFRLALTAKGRRLHARVTAAYGPALADLAAVLSPAELTRFRQTLDRLISAAPAIADRHG